MEYDYHANGTIASVRLPELASLLGCNLGEERLGLLVCLCVLRSLHGNRQRLLQATRESTARAGSQWKGERVSPDDRPSAVTTDT